MIGNDIIDLELALQKPRSVNDRFLNKVFTVEEKLQISESNKPELILWQIWSMKETAYKAHQRIHNFKPVFNPVDYHCDINSGVVKIGQAEYKSATHITKDYIHSLIVNDNLESSIFRNDENIETELINILSRANNAEKSDIVYQKNIENLPIYIDVKTDKSYPLSLSHHGRYAAIVFPLINS